MEKKARSKIVIAAAVGLLALTSTGRRKKDYNQSTYFWTMQFQEDVLRHVLGYVGPKNYIFIASVCRQWKRQCRLIHGPKNKRTRVGADVVSSLSILILHEQDIRAQSTSLASALDTEIGKYADLAMVQWLSARNQWTFSHRLAEGAIVGGRLGMLKWMRSNGIQPPGDCSSAAAGGHLNVLKWLRAIGCPWEGGQGILTCANAAKGGHLKVLKWARANGCPWNALTCLVAAKGGHLEVLKWARGNGCEWSSWTCSVAAQGGHLEVLKWARANGCPWGEGTCSAAAKGGHLEVLKWARANGCQWDHNTCRGAALGGHLEVLKWARSNGCDWDEGACFRAAQRGEDRGHAAIVQWIVAFRGEEAP